MIALNCENGDSQLHPFPKRSLSGKVQEIPAPDERFIEDQQKKSTDVDALDARSHMGSEHCEHVLI